MKPQFFRKILNNGMTIILEKRDLPILKVGSLWISLVVHFIPTFLALPGFVAVIYGMFFYKWERYWGH